MFRFFKFTFKLILLLVVACGLILAYARYIEPFWVRTKEIEVPSIYVSETANGLRIAAFADTHFGNHYSVKDFEKVIASLEKTQPDVVVFLGDLIDYFNEYIKTENIDEISAALARIQAPYGKYAVFGNHDYGGGAQKNYEGIMTAGGFTVLVNQDVILDDQGIQIIGVDDILIGYGDPSCAASARPDLFTILLCHEPDVADAILNYDIDLMIAGHTHGRQINIKYLDDYILPAYGTKYVKGSYPFDNDRQTALYVNSGIGMTKLPVRFLSPPEITVFTLKTGEKVP